MKKKMVLKQVLAVMLAITLAAVPAYAADFLEDFSAGEEETADFADRAEPEAFLDGSPAGEAATAAAPKKEPINPSPKYYDVSVTGTMVRSEVQEFVRLLNLEREAMGRPPVRLDQEMMEIAETRAAEGSLLYDHLRPDGSSGFGWSEAAQLSSVRDSDAESLLKAWKGSYAHWEGLTGTYDTRFGLGIYNQGTGI